MFSRIQRNATAFCLLIAMLATPFTGQQAYAQGDDGTILTDGYGHWDWDWDMPPENGCPHTIINISTGVDNAGTPLSAGATEPNWICPPSMGTVVNPVAAWGTFSGSRWVGITSYMSPGNYTYTRNFTLPAGASGIITFKAIADNRVKIYLDGGATPIAKTTPWDLYGFMLSRVATYTAIIGPGSHTLVADVENEGSVSGLDLEGTVEYTNTNTSIDLSTGMVNYTLWPIGAADPNWSCSTGYNLVTTPHAYWNNFTGSQWIGDGVYDVAVGAHDYYRTFTVPGSIGILSLEAMADNNGDFYLDGNYIGQTTGYTLGSKLTYYSVVTGGTHTLHVVVTNSEAMMGLNVHGNVAFCKSDYDNKGCMTDPNYTAAHAGPNTVAFFSSTNPMNTSTIFATVTHYWDFGDGSSSAAANPIHTYGMAASYLVTHTVTKTIAYPGGLRSRCSTKKSCWVTVAEDEAGRWFSIICDGDGTKGKPGVTVAQVQQGPFAIFPNPAQNELKISRQLNSCELSIFSVDGRSILHLSNFTGKKIDISALSSGSYILKIVENSTVTNLKFNKIQ